MDHIAQLLPLIGVAGECHIVYSSRLLTDLILALSTVRIWAVWEKALFPTLLVLLTGAFVPAVNVVCDIFSSVYFGS